MLPPQPRPPRIMPYAKIVVVSAGFVGASAPGCVPALPACALACARFAPGPFASASAPVVKPGCFIHVVLPMKNRRLIYWLGLLMASTALAQVESKAVELKSVPRPVQKAVQLWLAGGSLDNIDEVQEKGRVTYEVDFTSKEGKDRDFTLAENGTLLSLEIALADSPAPVQKILKGMIGTGTLDSIEKNLDGEDPTFDISIVNYNGKDNDFTLDAGGKMISQKMELTEAPDGIQGTIKAQVGANTIDDIEKLFDEDNTLTYQIGFTTKDGSSRSFTISGGDGRLESMEIGLTEAPSDVQKTIATEVGAGQFESLDKLFDSDGVIYEADYYTKAGREKRFTVGADGKLNSREVDLASAPAPVQQTIKQQIGNGRVLRIDHSFVEKDSGVFPFQVQAEKDGKPYDFSVGPKGRFLGMDD